MDPFVEVVCVYNNLDQYHNFLKSIQEQKTSYSIRILGIDNRNMQYSSMAKALNSTLSSLKSKFVIFSHQDIVFNNPNTLEEIIEELEKLDEVFICGIYGAKYPSRRTIHTKNAPMHVDTIDECIFAMPTEYIKSMRFNENICVDWHLYAVEICLRTNNRVYVVKGDVVHLSPGYITKKYVDSLNRLIESYSDHEYIWTTCAKVRLNRFKTIYISIWLLKHTLLNKKRKLKAMLADRLRQSTCRRNH